MRYAWGDVRDADAMRAAVAEADTVYHLAGLATAFSAHDLMRVNCEGFRNVATACAPCNMKKGGCTPEQAHMPLLIKPIRPTSWQLQERGKAFPPHYLHETWRDYLYWDTELEP